MRFRPAAPGEAPDILIGARGHAAAGRLRQRLARRRRAGRHRAADPRDDLLQSRGGLDRPGPARRRGRARPRDGAGARDRPRDRPRSSGRDRGADGLFQPGQHRPPDAGRHRRGGGALRAGEITGREKLSEKVRFLRGARTTRDGRAGGSRPERNAWRSAAGLQDVVPRRGAVLAAARGFSFRFAACMSADDSRVRLR